MREGVIWSVDSNYLALAIIEASRSDYGFVKMSKMLETYVYNGSG